MIVNRETKYLYFLALLYFVASFIGILHHELWLDESHHWLISRDSVSFADLIDNTRYEGHPILWNILLYGITRFTLNPIWMQLLHIVISAGAVLIFLKKAPFSLVFKTLFIFGYFVIFEYNLISRNYILGLFFLFLACSVFKDRNRKFILLCFFLALACNTHLIFGVIAFAVFLTLLLENFQNKKLFTKSHMIGYLVFLIGVLLVIAQVVPPDDNPFFIRLDTIPLAEKFIKGFISLFKGLLTIPDFHSIHFWNSNILVNYSKPLSAIFGLLLYLLPVVLFRNRKALFFVYVALFGTQVFFFVTQLGATRYDGITYVIFIIGFWIDHYFNDKKIAFLNTPMWEFIRKSIIYTILIIHFCSGMYAYAMDYKYPFTTAKNVVDYMKQKKLAEKEVVTITCDGTLISPFLEKKVYFLCDGNYESYCHWYRFCTTDITHKQIIDLLTGYMQNHDEAVFVSYYPITDNRDNRWENIEGKFKIRFYKRSGESIIRNNSLYIYEVAKLTYAE